MVCPLQFDWSIVATATDLHRRLATAASPPPVKSAGQALADARQRRWQHLLGGAAPYQRRIAWAGWKPPHVAAVLAEATPPPTEPPPHLDPLLRLATRTHARAWQASWQRLAYQQLAATTRVPVPPLLLTSLVHLASAPLRALVLPVLHVSPQANSFAAVLYTYPVLARLLAIRLHTTITNGSRLLHRLTRDLPTLQRTFGVRGLPRHATPTASDPHDGGQQVVLLHWADGQRLLYKPRSVAPDAAWATLLRWCNRRSGLPPFAPPTVLPCHDADGAYGWHAYVAAAPAADEPAAQRYYTRAGGMLALLWLLGASDGHATNLLAAADHPVLVDAETILAPRLPPLSGDQPERPATVLSTGMLPHWRGTPPRDTSGLGSAFAQPNYPVTNPAAHAAVLAGFHTMGRMLLRERAALLASDSPLTAFARVPVRVLLRSTNVYTTLWQQATTPGRLRAGIDFSLTFERLARPLLQTSAPPPILPALAAELAALNDGDIPRFVVAANARLLSLHAIAQPVPLLNSAIGMLYRRVRQLTPATITCHAHLLDQSIALAAPPPPAAPLSAAPPPPNTYAPLTPRQAVAAARVIADRLLESALHDDHGGLWWITPRPTATAGYYTLAPLDSTLYDGQTGIAVFLAALAHVTGIASYATASTAALLPVQQHIAGGAPPMPTGYTDGWGGIMQGLCWLADWQQSPVLVSLAADATRFLTPAALSTAPPDLAGGAAGALAGVLALAGAGAAPTITDEYRAACIAALQATQRPSGDWDTARHPASVAHGTLGIATPLLLAGDTEHGQRGIALVLAHLQQHLPPTARWCDGAAGTLLWLLASLPYLSPALHATARAACTRLAATLPTATPPVDHLCCGQAGVADALLVWSVHRNSPAAYHAATAHVAGILAHATAGGGYQWLPDRTRAVWVPGLWAGAAGLGYTLLRVAAPQQVPSLLLPPALPGAPGAPGAPKRFSRP